MSQWQILLLAPSQTLSYTCFYGDVLAHLVISFLKFYYASHVRTVFLFRTFPGKDKTALYSDVNLIRSGLSSMWPSSYVQCPDSFSSPIIQRWTRISPLQVSLVWAFTIFLVLINITNSSNLELFLLVPWTNAVFKGAII